MAVNLKGITAGIHSALHSYCTSIFFFFNSFPFEFFLWLFFHLVLLRSKSISVDDACNCFFRFCHSIIAYFEWTNPFSIKRYAHAYTPTNIKTKWVIEKNSRTQERNEINNSWQEKRSVLTKHQLNIHREFQTMKTFNMALCVQPASLLNQSMPP